MRVGGEATELRQIADLRRISGLQFQDKPLVEGTSARAEAEIVKEPP